MTLNVGIVYGGRSSEHSISCITARAIMEHLDGYEVTPIGITPDGTWVAGGDIEGDLPTVAGGREVTLSVNPTTRGRLTFADGSEYATCDVMFPVLHGLYGEDGTIQGMFELSGIPYVGNGVLASALAMDKSYARELIHHAGVRVDRRTLTLDEPRALTTKEQERLGLPVFVKPVCGGSSIGVSRVRTWDDLAAAIDLAFEHDRKVLIEAEVQGPELEIGVLQRPDGELVVSVPAQLRDTDASEGFYGFKTKYLDNVMTPLIPAPLSPHDAEELETFAKRAFRALDCEGLARVDFFLTPEGPSFNELNTLPGFTPISMYPQIFAASGIDYETLLDTMIQRALHARSHRSA